MSFIRAYLRASTKEQDAGRAREDLERFAKERGLAVAAWYEARKDYTDRRRRQVQGIEKAKADGRMRGRQEDAKRNAAISAMLKTGASWNQIVDVMGCSRATVAKLAKRDRAA